jgi:hypothetical protein
MEHMGGRFPKRQNYLELLAGVGRPVAMDGLRASMYNTIFTRSKTGIQDRKYQKFSNKHEIQNASARGYLRIKQKKQTK